MISVSILLANALIIRDAAVNNEPAIVTERHPYFLTSNDATGP